MHKGNRTPVLCPSFTSQAEKKKKTDTGTMTRSAEIAVAIFTSLI